MVEAHVKGQDGKSLAVLSAIIGSIIGGVACLIGLAALLNPGWAKALSLAFILPGLIVIPPLTELGRKHLPIMRPTYVPPTLAFGLWIVLMVCISPLVPRSSEEPKAQVGSEGVQSAPRSRQEVLAGVEQLITEGTAASTTQAMVDLNAAFAAIDLNTDPQLKPVMDRAKAAYEKASVAERAGGYAARLDGFWTDKLRDLPAISPTSPEEIWSRETVFADIARELEDGTQFKSDPTTARSMANLRRALVAKQNAVFPVLRRGYGQIVGRAVWEQDVEIIVQGSGGRTIRFVAGMFAANRNVASAQSNALPNIQKLRFGRAQYEWYRGSQYQYYSLETPADSAVGYWEAGRFVPVE